MNILVMLIIMAANIFVQGVLPAKFGCIDKCEFTSGLSIIEGRVSPIRLTDRDEQGMLQKNFSTGYRPMTTTVLIIVC